MSWFSKGLDQAYQIAGKIGAGAAAPLPKRWQSGATTAFRGGIFSTAGGAGLQYDYSRKKGMNSQEAQTNSLSGGYMYTQARSAQEQRLAADDAEAKAALLSEQMAQEELKARGQVAVRTRRSAILSAPSTKNGTILAGATIGSPNFAGTSFSTQLGL